MSPQRVQRRRVKGWRPPVCSCGCGEPARYVGRGSRWATPFAYRDRSSGLVRYGPDHLARFGRDWDYEGRCSAAGARHDMWFSKDDVVTTFVRYATRAEVVELYRLTLSAPTPGMRMAYPSNGRILDAGPGEIRAELAGHDLMCWCPLDQPCHADVLLDIANHQADR